MSSTGLTYFTSVEAIIRTTAPGPLSQVGDQLRTLITEAVQLQWINKLETDLTLTGSGRDDPLRRDPCARLCYTYIHVFFIHLLDNNVVSSTTADL